jgi:signal transduction histidine kinase
MSVTSGRACAACGAGAAHHERGHASELRVPSPVRELHELSLGLDHIRVELVGANEELRMQIREKELIELRRLGLERQLQHQQRVEIVGTLAGGIAHEFNNVLVPIILLSELVIKRLPEDMNRGRCDDHISAARRA